MNDVFELIVILVILTGCQKKSNVEFFIFVNIFVAYTTNFKMIHLFTFLSKTFIKFSLFTSSFSCPPLFHHLFLFFTNKYPSPPDMGDTSYENSDRFKTRSTDGLIKVARYFPFWCFVFDIVFDSSSFSYPYKINFNGHKNEKVFIVSRGRAMPFVWHRTGELLQSAPLRRHLSYRLVILFYHIVFCFTTKFSCFYHIMFSYFIRNSWLFTICFSVLSYKFPVLLFGFLFFHMFFCFIVRFTYSFTILFSWFIIRVCLIKFLPFCVFIIPNILLLLLYGFSVLPYVFLFYHMSLPLYNYVFLFYYTISLYNYKVFLFLQYVFLLC